MPDTPDRSRNTGPALEKWYQFLRWLTPVLEKFPRSHKFTLGERIYTGALDVLDSLIEATYSRHATPMLLQAIAQPISNPTVWRPEFIRDLAI